MKEYNRKYVSWRIYTRTLCREVAPPFDYYYNAQECIKNPEKFLVNQTDIKDIKNGNCVIRKTTQEWHEA